MNLPSALVVKVSSLSIEDCIVELIYAAPMLKLKVKVNDEKLTYTLLDTRVEVNIITSELAREASLMVYPHLHMTLIAYEGEHRWFDSIYKDVEISVRGIYSINLVFIVLKVDQWLLLGQPFIWNTWLSQNPHEDSMYTTLWDPDYTQSVKAWVSSWDDTGIKYQKDIFLVGK